MTRETKTILIVMISGLLLVGGLFAYEVFAESAEKEEGVTDEPIDRKSVV